MEIITFDHKVYQDLNDKIERIADYVFKKEKNPVQEPEIWLTSDELADLLKISTRTLWKIQCKLPPKTKRFCPLVLK